MNKKIAAILAALAVCVPRGIKVWGRIRPLDASAFTHTGDDKLIRATALSGGGMAGVYVIELPDGQRYRTANLRDGIVIDKIGGYFPQADDDGIYYVTDSNVSPPVRRPVTADDFYDEDTMAEVGEFAFRRGFVASSIRYQISKSAKSPDMIRRIIDSIALAPIGNKARYELLCHIMDRGLMPPEMSHGFDTRAADLPVG